jgi:hypothetical protein
MVSLLNFPPITGLDLGRSRFMQNRKIFSRSSTGRRSKSDIFLFDLIFFRVLVLDFLTSGEKSVLATLAGGGRGLRRRPFGLFYSFIREVNTMGRLSSYQCFSRCDGRFAVIFLDLAWDLDRSQRRWHGERSC